MAGMAVGASPPERLAMPAWNLMAIPCAGASSCLCHVQAPKNTHRDFSPSVFVQCSAPATMLILMPYKILTIDDHALVCEGLSLLVV